MFSFYTLGVMSGAAEEVATGAEVTATQQTILALLKPIFFYSISLLDYNTSVRKWIRRKKNVFILSFQLKFRE